MGRKSAKPTKRAPRRVPRAAKKDKKGIPLTSDYRPFTLLPSDLAAAMRQPPGAPRKATRKIEPAEPTTLIPELNAIEFTPFAYQTVIEAIDASDNVQIQKLNPKGGANLRYRIEAAAAFLAHVMDHAYNASVATSSNANDLLHLATNLVIRRAQEIYGQSGA